MNTYDDGINPFAKQDVLYTTVNPLAAHSGLRTAPIWNQYVTPVIINHNKQ